MSRFEMERARGGPSLRSFKELLFLFQSLYFYLEHLDSRLAFWDKTLGALLSGLSAQSQRNERLEQELEASSSLVAELREQLSLSFADQGNEIFAELFQRLRGLPTHPEPASAPSSQWNALQQETEILALAYAFLSERLGAEKSELLEYFSDLEALEERLLTYQRQFEKFEAEIALLQTRALEHQKNMLNWQESRAESERLIAEQAERIQELQDFIERQQFESDQRIENLNDILEKTARDTLSLQKGRQDAGISLVRMAQLKNEAEAKAQQLKQELATVLSQYEALQAEGQQPERSSSPEKQHQILNQARFQVLLEWLPFLSFLNPEQQNQVTQKMAHALHISPEHQQVLQTRAQAGQVFFRHAMREFLPAHVSELQTKGAMAWIPEGVYPIGDALHSSERPVHSQKTEGFYLDFFPVSNAEFSEFMQAGGYQRADFWLPQGWAFVQEQQLTGPAFWNLPGHCCGEDYPDFPVVGVSWYEAVAFANWAEKRLPTEVEWEMAARGIEGLIWPWGNQWQEERANTAETGLLTLCPSGSYPLGKSPFGCFDMIGQVYEWTQSIYQTYPYQADDGREDLVAAGARTLKGCSWGVRGTFFTRSSYRFFQPPTHRHSDIGFRCAKHSGDHAIGANFNG
ncbi:hypothetical protein COW36_14600 [bacterium (Candidatus Blackallbacteria) CG17_big_fil_post_rev_8_21_14_2_50_48_46]|uniref:Sulfatase-modifying factor enzyme-like domain-containing protein n=1 Tax=bacterium (Candidatus Blackallbacteria) CG17_big_fil_post_rev_8_21_14_2_50_48_46 TaxID=2014261 RepID=A0A2M7G2C4_9BACT|nr:MAG: hypothetical protein COW64_11950 [bacterium (Candidatus Blackallbacteria) CG18_big_fil_WC_8_21_14_2_50_49_26]PIW15944.1 MAG: hypothetical protein COW36_14600 [bacterium (Candidatus Blackallbacteria) CG17_big_fil_post_rev_8_21_14_2_50_48_46]PIW50356.1 MAG: hypothetical protein COW20_02315 [bacterium (Candidatus Blackallbacteria) CG13_big_fil_rev_8_21_14_2_50_49_14]